MQFAALRAIEYIIIWIAALIYDNDRNTTLDWLSFVVHYEVDIVHVSPLIWLDDFDFASLCCLKRQVGILHIINLTSRFRTSSYDFVFWSYSARIMIRVEPFNMTTGATNALSLFNFQAG